MTSKPLHLTGRVAHIPVTCAGPLSCHPQPCSSESSFQAVLNRTLFSSIISEPIHLSFPQKAKYQFKHNKGKHFVHVHGAGWGLSPGPQLCQAWALPPSYIPQLLERFFFKIWYIKFYNIFSDMKTSFSKNGGRLLLILKASRMKSLKFLNFYFERTDAQNKLHLHLLFLYTL